MSIIFLHNYTVLFAFSIFGAVSSSFLEDIFTGLQHDFSGFGAGFGVGRFPDGNKRKKALKRENLEKQTMYYPIKSGNSGNFSNSCHKLTFFLTAAVTNE